MKQTIDIKKYWIICWLGCLIILGYLFYSEIQHQKRIDEIFKNK